MRKLLFIFGFLSVCSCMTKQQECDLVDVFQNKQNSYPKEARVCVIIPEGGCGGCIAAGMSFVRDNKAVFSNAQRSNVVVFTRIHSMKLLRRQLGDVAVESLNSIVDTMGIYSVDSKEGVYPIILYLDDGNVKSVDVASPQTDAFVKLGKKL